jgi:single-stranded-DNA-specific exonuclease
LAQAVARQETVVVYGDYDVDGLTATAVLRHFLESLGTPVVSYIPNRLTQGYGLHGPSLPDLAARAAVLVTVDCGVSNAAEVAQARDLGLDIIVTDHHEPPVELPPALAVVNPKRPDCGYAFKDLAGVGVALNLVLGLRACLRHRGWFADRPQPDPKDYLDLVALGTAADVAPLIGVNRILVSRGLNLLADSPRPGIQALKEVAGLPPGPLSLRDVVFKLAPRLNAAGRLGQARAALELLLTRDLGHARQLARVLDRLNKARQAEQSVILAAAETRIRQQGLLNRPALVLADPDWHPGIIGIVAAKLAERYHRPVALLVQENGLGRGSARSVAAFDLYAGLCACEQHLMQFGGHPAAAGFTLDLERLEAFREAFEAVVQAQLGDTPGPPDLALDAEVSLTELDDEFFFHLNRLRPFGQGNPEPVLACLSAECIDSWVVGGKHLKLKIAQNGRILTAIAFDQAALHPLRGRYDVAFSPRLNFFQGRAQPELLILDLGSASP